MKQAAAIDGLINSMEDLDPAREKATLLIDVVKGPLSESVKALERQSHDLPTGQDFHFYSNFQEFKRPVATVQSRVVSLLSQLGSLKDVIPHPAAFPADVDEGYDWLVGVQDALLERVDASLDKFHQDRRDEHKQKVELNAFEATSRQNLSKKTPVSAGIASEGSKPADVKMARSKDKSTMRSPIPFHIPSIPRPQDKFDDAVDNSNTPFRHKSLKRRIQMESAGDDTGKACGDMSSVSTLSVLEEHASKLGHKDPANNTHPLEDELTKMAYVEGLLDTVEIRKYGSLHDTPFTFVSTPNALKKMAVKLRKAGEIAIDLENHHYRSYQGFVCLMQVSTRDEDFIVDTLDLRSEIGPCLADIFADATIRKVMHGADRDIVWLQRDFGIYVCNLFDTGQAARVLELPGCGLAFLLEHFCKVHADKRYQLADWRIRPLPAEMIKYAREDTHYLLYVHDMLKQLLMDARANKKAEEEDPVSQVYKRSRDLCLQLYAKEIFTETSYQHLYGLQERKFQVHQLAVLSALYSWRDTIARKEDESTGFVMPNHLLLQLADELPTNVRQLQSFVKGSHSFVSRHASTIIGIIRQTKKKVWRELKELDASHLEPEEGELTGESPREDIVSERMNSEVSEVTQSLQISDREGDQPSAVSEISPLLVTDREEKTPQIEVNAISVDESNIPTSVVPENASIIQAKRKPSKLGAWFGGRKRGSQTGPSESAKDVEQARMKTEEIESTMVLPFDLRVQSLADLPGMNEQPPFAGEEQAITGPEENLDDSNGILHEVCGRSIPEETSERPASSTTPELPDVLMLETEADEDLKEPRKHRAWWPPTGDESGSKRKRDSKSPRTARDQAFDRSHGDRNPEIPMSLSEMHRSSHRGKKKARTHSEASSNGGNPEVPARDLDSRGSGSKSKKRRKEQSLVTEDYTQTKRMASTDNKLDLRSFDYREARDALGLKNLYTTEKVDDRKGKGSHGRGRGSKKDSSSIPLSKTAFDPLRRTREEPRPEGIKPGQRRQVFPQSGNRTAVFKQ